MEPQELNELREKVRVGNRLVDGIDELTKFAAQLIQHRKEKECTTIRMLFYGNEQGVRTEFAADVLDEVVINRVLDSIQNKIGDRLDELNLELKEL